MSVWHLLIVFISSLFLWGKRESKWNCIHCKKYIIICLSVHYSVDLYVASSLGLLWINQIWTFAFKHFCGHRFSFLLGITGSYGKSMFSFKKLKTFLSSSSIYTYTSNIWTVHLFHIFANILFSFYPLLNCTDFIMCNMVTHGFNFHINCASLMTKYKMN